MKESYTRNLIMGFGLSLFLLVLSSVASYVSIQNLLDSARWVNHTNEVIKELESIISTMKDAETGQRGYLLTGESVFLEPYHGAYDKALKNLALVQQNTLDNKAQQEKALQLKEIIQKRLNILSVLIENKRVHISPTLSDLLRGKQFMDQARKVVINMEERENTLLASRTNRLRNFSSFTPILVILVFLISIGITIFFFIRIRNDFRLREQLQKDLNSRDELTMKRIDAIQSITERISNGDYSLKIDAEADDTLGVLSGNLNRMTLALEKSFNELSLNEWLQTSLGNLAEYLLVEKDELQMAREVITYLSETSGSQVGLIYLPSENSTLSRFASYAFPNDLNETERINVSGAVRESFDSGKVILLNNIPPGQLSLSFGIGEVNLKSLICLPIFHGRSVSGVIELGSIDEFSEIQVSFLQKASTAIGMALHTAQNRKRVQSLLEETQAQSEELQSQHAELEDLNTVLEGNTQKLQASEEELRVQQEELLQINQELEERTRLLEEKNQLIVERNFDIQKKAEELELSTRYKSEFMANMSHELRTPLNSILLLSRLLSENRSANLDEEQIESAKVILSSGNGLLSLIDEILDLSKIEAGKMTLEYAQVSFNEIKQDIKTLFEPIAKEKNIKFHYNNQPDLPLLFQTDKQRLEQILKNLISNALKFTSSGSVVVEAYLHKSKTDWVSFSIQDTGIGIAPDKTLLVFEAFQQADGSTRRKYGGTGLGLSISRELAKLLNGELVLQSELNKGSIFTVSLPLHKLNKTFENKLHSNNRHSEPAFDSFNKESSGHSLETPYEGDLQKNYLSEYIPEEILDDRSQIKHGEPSILIVEDDTHFAKILMDHAHRNGYKCLVAVRGDHAIELAKTFNPSAILLDIVLPVKNGWQVMDELKANPETRPIPVHMMSSLDARRESLLKGAVDFINKPFAIEQVDNIIQKLEAVIHKKHKKVLIIEENNRHAQALGNFLNTYQVNSEISGSIKDSLIKLRQKEIDCVILDMGLPDHNSYKTLEEIKKEPGLELLPIIVFTGKSLSRSEEIRIRQYADTIVVKTAFSYQRILDEVSLFLHLVSNQRATDSHQPLPYRLGDFSEVLKNKKVLIADDDVRNIFSLTKSLEQHQMKIISALDGREALVKLAENPDTDIVLMDMMMPEMDGYESTAAIRKKPEFKNLPILAVTAKAMMGDREKCISAGASDYISKPVDIDQLLSLLRVWLYDKQM